jgi:MFS family permease
VSRSLAALFAATFLELTGLFLFGPLLLFTLKARGLDTAAVGAFAALQWLGLLMATPFAGSWVQRLGPRAALLASGAVPLLALAGMQLSTNLALWALLYAVAGMASALRWILAEATVAEQAPPQRRGRLMGAFAMMIGLTFMAGPALLSALLAAGWSTLAIGWVAVGLVGTALLALLPVNAAGRALALDAEPEAAAAPPTGWRGTWQALRATPLLMLSGLVGGFFEAGLAGVLPLYGLTAGFGVAVSALLVSASGLGSTLLPLPLGELADRLPRAVVRRACFAAALLAAVLLPAVPWLGTAAAPAAALLAGVCGGAGAGLYTLAMVDIGHRQQGVALVNSTSVLVLSYTCGGLLAPLLGGAVLQWLPLPAFGGLLAAVALPGLLWRPPRSPA